MIATNKQIKDTLVWFVNFHSKKIPLLVKEYLKDNSRASEIQTIIDSHFHSIHTYVELYRKLFPNEEMLLNG